MPSPLPDLHIFKEDLKIKPAPGSNAPPVSIRARDLDDNNKKITVIRSKLAARTQVFPDYTPEYTNDGTMLTFEGFDAYICEDGEAVQYRILGQRLETLLA